MKSKIKKMYIDKESSYIEVEFENGEKHQLCPIGSGVKTPDKDYTHAYECDMCFEDE